MKSEEKTGQGRQQNPARPGTGAKRRSSHSARRRPAGKTAAAAGRKSAPERRASAASGRSAAPNRRRRPAKRPNKTVNTVRRSVPREREPLPEVVYTPPKQFNRNRFLLQLVTMVAVVLALTFVFSIFFKVKTITVSGTVKYDVWTVREASGIQEGEGLLTFGQAKAAGKIKTALPYVKSVRIGIKLPDTVNIEIVETDVAYSISATDGTWWLMTAEGKILEQTTQEAAAEVTTITGIELATPVETQAEAYEEVMQNAFGDTIPASETAAERMGVVKQILQNLEMNGIMGEVTTVDVSVPADLQLWYGEKYQIKLGDSSRIAHKITSMQTVFEQEAFLEAGCIDVSFSDEERPNDVIFVPFTE